MRTFSITLLALVLLTACSGGSADPDQNTPELPTPEVRVSSAPGRTPPPTERPTPIPDSIGIGAEALEAVAIDFWHVWSWESGQALEDLVSEFNITNPYGIRVTALNQETYSDLANALEDSLRQGEGPDLTVGFNNQLFTWDNEWAILRDLNDYLNDPDWGWTPEEQEDFYPVFWGQDMVAEKRLGLPAQRSAQVLFYNRTWAEELGFENAPATLEEFREQTCAAARQNRDDSDAANDSTGGWVIDTSTATVFSWIAAMGGQVETAGGYDFNTEEVSETFAFLKGLFDEGCGWLSQNRYPNPEFATRRALFISSSTAGIPFQEEAFGDSESTDDWAGIAYPGEARDGVVGVFGPSFAMLKSSPQEELASWLLIKWLLEPENQARWIRASGHLPSRASAVEELGFYSTEHPQWAEAVDLLPLALPEPGHASWGSVRWALSDAAEQVFRLGLTRDQIPALLRELDETATEMHARSG